MLPQETGSHGIRIESVDLDALVSRAGAGDEGDVTAGKVERLSEEGDEGVVRGAIDRRRRQPDQNRPGALAVNARARGSGYDAKLQTADCQLPTGN